MAECILMQGGGGVMSDDLTATSANVLATKKYMGSDTDSEIGTGTMTNNGAISKTFTPTTSAQSYTVPLGYHNGSGKVTVNATPTQTKTAYATTSAQTIKPDSGKFLSQVTVGALSQANLSASYIKKGVNVRVANGSTNVYNVTGTYDPSPVLARSYSNTCFNSSGVESSFTCTSRGFLVINYKKNQNDRSGDCAWLKLNGVEQTSMNTQISVKSGDVITTKIACIGYGGGQWSGIAYVVYYY